MSEEHEHEHDITDIAGLRPGDHLCCLYETEEEHRALVTPYIRQGLERNEKVFYIVDAHTSEEILAYLRSDDLDVEAYLASGQLSILTRDDSYMREGTFDPDGMISLLRSETDLAQEQGYTCLRVTGEMTWALRGLPGSERLIEYEAKLNDFFPGSRAMAICQYDRRRFSPEILLEVLTTHPIAVIGTRVYPNFYFMPTEEFLQEDRSAATLAHWLRNLEDRQRAAEALAENEERFRGLVEQSTNGIVLVDRQGRIIEWNRSMEEIAGIERQEALGQYLWDIQFSLAVEERRTPETYRQLKETIVSGLQSGGAPWLNRVYEQEIRRYNGSRGYVQTITFPIRTSRDFVLASISSDITARRAAEEKLRDQYSMLEGIMHSTDNPIFSVDAEYCYTSFNRVHAAVMKAIYNADIEVGKSMLEYQTMQEDRIKAQANIDRALRGERFTAEDYSGEEMLSRRFFEVSHNPIIGFDGKVVGVAVYARDVTESKKDAEALMKSEERYRSLFDSSKDGILVTDMGGNILDANRAYLDMLGYQLEELKRLTYQQLTPEKWQQLEAEIVGEQITKNSYSDEYEKEYIRKDGTVFPITIRVWTFLDDQGNPVGMWGIVRDITESKRVENDLRETSDYLDSLIEYANAPIIVWDPEMLITRFNRAFERLSGYTAEEVVGRELAMIFPRESRDRSLEEIARAVAGEHWESVEIPILRKDGDIRLALWNSANIYREDGEALIATIAQGTDITERKVVEEALAESQERYKALFERSMDCVFIQDFQGGFLDANEAALDLLGYEKEETTSLNFVSLLSEDQLPQALEGVQEILETGTQQFPIELRLRRKDGGYVYVESKGSLIYRDGKPYAVQGIARDITARVERERKMEQMNADLQAFAHTLSHDLKAPLSNATGYALTLERMLEGRLNARETDILDVTVHSLRSMDRTINGMLQYASLDKKEGSSGDVNLDEVLRGILEELRGSGLLEENCRIETASLPTITGDAARLRQVFYNLISNAAKFTAEMEEPVIEVGIEETPAGRAVYIRDNGPGIRPEDLKSIFEPLTRTDQAAAVPGYGLGLAIVKRAVHSWGGRVWAESQPGRGATFYFTL